MSEINELFASKITHRKMLVSDLFNTVGTQKGLERVLRNVYSALNIMRHKYLLPDEKSVIEILIDLEAVFEILKDKISEVEE